jgi:peroxiredoxin
MSLPIPEDDGAAAHLPGMHMPDLALPSTSGEAVDLARLRTRTILYVYPLIAPASGAVPDGWDTIPGARGCTPESCSFRDHYAELQALDADVLGLSSQSTDEQREARERLHLPFDLVSDERLQVADALRLPTFAAGGRTLLKRLTLVVADGAVEHVFYPIFPPGEHAGEVLAWLGERTAGAG